MIRLTREVTGPRPAEEVFAYLSDFSTTTEWDPGSVRTTRLDGDGGVGTRYHNVSRFNGRETELVYEVIERSPGMIRLRGSNATVTAVDTITVDTVAAGTRVIYDAQFTFRGVARLAEPFLRRAFQRLADEAEEGLRRVVAG